MQASDGAWVDFRLQEALDKVMTVRDFSMVYDAYVQFEDTMITAKMEMMGDDEEDEEEEEEAKTDGDDDGAWGMGYGVWDTEN